MKEMLSLHCVVLMELQLCNMCEYVVGMMDVVAVSNCTIFNMKPAIGRMIILGKRPAVISKSSCFMGISVRYPTN